MIDHDPLPLHVSTFDPQISATGIIKAFSVTVGWASLTWTANLSVFCPIALPFDYPVNRVWWVNGGTASSNVNFGIFTKEGKRLYATGSTAQSGASIAQYVTPSPTFVLPKGEYYFAFSCDGTTNRAAGNGAAVQTQIVAGVLQQASNFALADPATFAVPSVAVYPYCGVTRTTAGF